MAETGAESRTAIAAAESENNAEGGGTERNKERELVDYGEAASQRDWWKKSVRIKLHKNPKLRERGSQKRYQEGFFAQFEYAAENFFAPPAGRTSSML
jgi:hypothetical protein